MNLLREEIIKAIKQEVVGPGEAGPYKDKETGEELLLDFVHGSPLNRYGAGILFPRETINNLDDGSCTVREDEEGDPGDQEEREGEVSEDIGAGKGGSEDMETEDDPLSYANSLKPSSMGLTFALKKGDESFTVIIKGATYLKGHGTFPRFQNDEKGNPIRSNSAESSFWIRKPFVWEIQIVPDAMPEPGKRTAYKIPVHNDDEFLSLTVVNRTDPKAETEGQSIITVSVSNMKSVSDRYPKNEECIFQSEIKIQSDYLKPFREKSFADDEEGQMLNLLYREKRSYGAGHGVSVEWELGNSPKWLKTAAIPVYEVPLVEPTTYVTLPMYDLSDLPEKDKSGLILSQLLKQYGAWIDGIEEELKVLPGRYKDAAKKNIEECRTSYNRIKKGIELLEKDSRVAHAFRLMNHAMLWQQQRSKISQRRWNRKGNVVKDLESAGDKDLCDLKEFQEPEHKGKWRPFQLAFILMNLESVVFPNSEEREIVELIWFPTGGGKTEAYLGLAAFTIFWKRMLIKGDADGAGTSMLMRYTLRLLTTQQFERACSMIVACDRIVRDSENTEYFGWGQVPVSIGLWVGGANTPNDKKGAVKDFKNLNQKKYTDYNFILLKCPCCGAQIGKLDDNQSTKTTRVKGLRKGDGANGSVYFSCDNKECDTYGDDLPIYVVDEDIYEQTPDLVLATVDKIAMVPFKKQAGRLFGFRENADRTVTRVRPPELIIQDELHLISGPLGTMVGLYEAMVQTLCRNYEGAEGKFAGADLPYVPPKIVASTATISRAEEQVRSLYAREKLHIFPSQGLRFGDTWFSQEKDPAEKPGRKYVGIMPQGYPSAQTAIVRTYAAVLQKVKDMEASSNLNDLDYYWTLVGYFNSIRELGGAVNLVFADINERIRQIAKRNLDKELRYNLYPLELTSRISSSKIPEFLKKLEVTKQEEKVSGEDEKAENKYAKDLCLATNMIATGVDISRFGLMFVHGQPKTTAEYIQASSRVGRDTTNGPGLVFTLFNSNKARDKSQFEYFQTYHSRIYASVEPTSVTPFSIVARERALHAVMVGLIRHLSRTELRQNPDIQSQDFEEMVVFVKEVIGQRVAVINPDIAEEVMADVQEFIQKWKDNRYAEYGHAGDINLGKKEVVPMMYNSAGQSENSEKAKSSNKTPASMRGVDTESKIGILR